MDQTLASENELLERRLTLMRELASSLERAYAAVAKADLGAMSSETANEETLCEQLCQIIPRLPQSLSTATEARKTRTGPEQLPEGPSSACERWSILLRHLKDVETRIAQLNRAYGALLRRARRTVDIFCRVLAHSGITYPSPVHQPVSAIQAMRE
jgi:hypothetical protein